MRRRDEEPSPYDLREHRGEWWLQWRKVEAFFTPWRMVKREELQAVWGAVVGKGVRRLRAPAA